MLITPHFSLEEFACKDKAKTPYPAEWIEPRLRPLCEMLEVIREEAGVPITVLSGYRTPVYNWRVGGAHRSQHVHGRAADIRAKGWSAAKLHELILRLYREGKLPQLGGLGQYESFVHVDVRPRPASGRIAQWRGKRTAAEVV